MSKNIPGLPFLATILTVDNDLRMAKAHFDAGHMGPASELFGRILKANQDHAEALYYLGRLAYLQGRYGEAVLLSARAVDNHPSDAGYWYQLGLACRSAGDLGRSEIYFLQAVKRTNASADAWLAAAGVCRGRNDLVDEEHCYRKAMEVDAGCEGARKGLSDVLARKAVRSPEELAAAENELASGLQCHADGKHPEAKAHFLKAVELNPQLTGAHCNLGVLLEREGDEAGAMALYQKTLEIDPGFCNALYNLGHLYHARGDDRSAEEQYQLAVKANSTQSGALNNLGVIYQGRMDYAKAFEYYRQASEAKPDFGHALVQAAHALQNLCQWQDWEFFARRVKELVAAGRGEGVYPFSFMALGTTLAEQFECASQFSRGLEAERPDVPPFVPRDTKARLRIGYLSADFRDHAMARLVTEMFELHDREQVEVFGYSYSPYDGSAARTRIEAAVDCFRDIRELSEEGMARVMREDRLDILVDLMGYTGHSRPRVLVYRVAPIQAQMLGYIGTMGMSSVDYLIADNFVAPEADFKWYREKIVHLPDVYQPNDRKKEMGTTPTRKAAGLPAKGVVFCAFHNAYKILPDVFSSWMRMLLRVPGSVLWLVAPSDKVVENLKSEAAARGVDSQRLIFMRKLPYPDYLAHLQLADMYVDSWTYNAGTTASEALWVGVPVVTKAGDTYVTRMAGSLVAAAGVPELVARTEQEYEDLAVALAMNSQRRGALKRKLKARRDTSVLFDTPAFTRNLEQAYKMMSARHEAGLPPEHLSVSKAEDIS